MERADGKRGLVISGIYRLIDFLADHIDFLKIIAYNKGTDMNLLRVNA